MNERDDDRFVVTPDDVKITRRPETKIEKAAAEDKPRDDLWPRSQ